MRASVFFGAFALILFPSSISFAAYPGECNIVLYRCVASSLTSGWDGGWTIESSGAITQSGSFSYAGPGNVQQCTVANYFYENGSWYSFTKGGAFSQLGGGYSVDPSQISNLNTPSVLIDAGYLNPGCAPPPIPCDETDSDGDGVCNTCDQAPGTPDPDDCLVGSSVDAAGKITHVAIQKGCSGENFEHWTSESHSASDRFIADVGSTSAGKLNCAQNCTMENPCVYSSGGLADTMAGLEPYSTPLVPGIDEQLEELMDLPPPDELPQRCDGHNAQCEQYCSDKLGVALSYCRDDAGRKKSDCQCNNNFAYQMTTGDEDSNPQTAADSANLNKDTNSNGVPDYADDSIHNSGDIDSDGITDKADVDQTGGQDADGNGIDDTYTSNAQASASASAGLSASDSLNLDSIATSTAQTSAAARGLKTGIDKIAENTGDLLDKADAALADSQAIRGQLEGFTEQNTDSLSDVEQALNAGPFTGISENDIPDDPTSEENFDVDSFVSEFSFAFPDEMKDLIDGSKIETTNSDSCISGTVMGQQIQFCFDQFHAVFVAMGILFQGLCVFRAFGIVVGGFGR